MTSSPPQRATTFISSTFLTRPDTARLGRLVLDRRNPGNIYCDLFPNQDELIHSSAFEISISPSVDPTSVYNSTRIKTLQDALHKLFTRFPKGVTLEGEAQRYQLENPHIALSKACAQPHVREWLQEYVIKPKLDAHMVVAFHVLKSPKVAQDNKNFTVAAALRGFGFEGIWGVQYRKVVCELTHWAADVQLNLKENHWLMPWSVRGQDNTVQHRAEAELVGAAKPDPPDSDDEDEEPPESYFVTSNDSEEVLEEFIFFHDHEDEGSPAEL